MATAITARLDRITRASGYLVGYNPTLRRRKNRFPMANTKPFALYIELKPKNEGEKTVWAFVASFATPEALEVNWRGRAGC